MAKSKPTPSTVKFSSELQEQIAEAAQKTNLPKQEVIRLCTAIGIESLRKIKWDISKIISEAADLKTK